MLKMKRAVFLLLAAVLLIPVAACAAQPAAAGLLKSDKPRITTPTVAPGDAAVLEQGNTAFALALYRLLSREPGNLFYSPYSISQALAMTWAGARGATETQMADALDFLLSQDRLHPAFNALALELAKRAQESSNENAPKPFVLDIVNALWGQTGFPFSEAYLDLLAQNYDAGLRTLDFDKDPEGSRKTINDWVAEQTRDRIKDLIPQGAIDELTRLVLTNAIYFNASWQSPFKEENTADGTFTRLDGSTVTVPLMHQSGKYRYAEGNGYQAVEILYDGARTSMVVLLPEPGNFAAFESSLDVAKLNGIIGDLGTWMVDLTMPKFQYESEFGLAPALKALGMTDAFDPNTADFSGMDGARDLYVQDVVHKAFVSVDEAGTEAAAATAVIVGTTSMPPGPVAFTMDRPFIYLIRDIPTGAILFLGRVTDPAA